MQTIMHQYLKSVWVLGIFFSYTQCSQHYMYTYQPDEIEWALGDDFSFIQLEAGDTVASIGAATGWFEVAYSTYRDSLVFYVEDIDPESLQQKNLDKLLRFYERKFDEPISNTFILQLGTESSTKLPSNTFDKVLLRLSFHEFSERDAMMKEVLRILKPRGIFYMAETLVDSTGKLEPNCGHPLLSKEDLLKDMQAYGFQEIGMSDPSYSFEEDSSYVFTMIRFQQKRSK